MAGVTQKSHGHKITLCCTTVSLFKFFFIFIIIKHTQNKLSAISLKIRRCRKPLCRHYKPLHARRRSNQYGLKRKNAEAVDPTRRPVIFPARAYGKRMCEEGSERKVVRRMQTTLTKQFLFIVKYVIM